MCETSDAVKWIEIVHDYHLFDYVMLILNTPFAGSLPLKAFLFKLLVLEAVM